MDGGCPVLFNNVKGKPNHRVITNLFGDMAIINGMFGWKDDAERVRKLAYALSHPVPPAEISQSERRARSTSSSHRATSTNGWCRSATLPMSPNSPSAPEFVASPARNSRVAPTSAITA